MIFNVAIVEDETNRAPNECGIKTVVLLLNLLFLKFVPEHLISTRQPTEKLRGNHV